MIESMEVRKNELGKWIGVVHYTNGCYDASSRPTMLEAWQFCYVHAARLDGATLEMEPINGTVV